MYPNNQIRGLLYRTTNQGDTWYYQVPDTSIHITSPSFIDFINRLNGWVYLDTPTGIHTVTGGDTSFFLPVHQISSEVPKEYILFQNYPNPFNPKTKIKYQIVKNVKHETSNVKLIIYDITGKEVIILVNGKQSAGIYEVDFTGNGYSSGIYFYSLAVEGNVIDTKKMILIK